MDDTDRPARAIRSRRAVAAVVLVVLAVGAIAAVRSIHRTEVLGVSRIEASSEAVTLTVVASHNDCSNDPTARIVDQTAEAVTVRAERRRNLLADGCDDVGAQTSFPLALAEPLGDRSIRVEAPHGRFECVVDGAPSDRCIATEG